MLVPTFCGAFAGGSTDLIKWNAADPAKISGASSPNRQKCSDNPFLPETTRKASGKNVGNWKFKFECCRRTTAKWRRAANLT
jgi:hypothetical protein